MDKQDFLTQLRKALSDLPREDIAEHLTFYSEMIDDRIEEGLSEAEAVSAMGPVEQIAMQILSDKSNPIEEAPKPKRQRKTWEIVLLILGSPIWLSLGIAAVSVVFSLYVSLWSVIVSLWASFGAVVCGALGGIAGGILLACQGFGLSGTAMIAAGLICAGLSILLFLGCKFTTATIAFASKKIFIWYKKRFTKKEVKS